MNYVKYICLISIFLLSMDGFAQGQITRRPTTQSTSKRTKPTPTASAVGEKHSKDVNQAHSSSSLDKKVTQIFYGARETDIADSERGKVENVVKFLKANPEFKVRVTGYADGRKGGNPRILMKYSQERADRVAEALVDAGIDVARITLSALGDCVQFTDGYVMNRVTIVLSDMIDLGLPSGTLWKATNEVDFYTYDEVVSNYGNKLPTIEQFEELRDKCTWSWTGSGYKVTGPNGNSIVLPAAGYRDCFGVVGRVGSDGYYWSSTPDGSEDAWSLYFNSDRVDMYGDTRCYGLSVRLVQGQ